MRQPRRTLSRLCQCLATAFVFCQGLANAATVGVMADESTGRLHPASVEERMAGLSAEVELAPGESVTVPGIVQAVYSDSEANKAEVASLNQYFPTNRVEFENWGRGAHGFTYTSNNMLLEGGELEKLAAGVAIVTRSNGTVWVDSVQIHTNPPAAGVEFHPALPEQQSIAIDSIRAAILDAAGLHYGPQTGAIAFSAVPLATAANYNALATPDGVTWFRAYSQGGVLKSTDGGRTWQKLANAPVGPNNQAALACGSGGEVYLAYSTYNTSLGGLFRSLDNGETWQRLAGAPSGSSPYIAAAGSIVFAGTGGGIWRSVDRGETWEQLATAPHADFSALATADGITVFCATPSSGTWISRDSGDSWTQLANAPTSLGSCALATDGFSVILAAQNGFWTSGDAGGSWQPVARPSGTTLFPALASGGSGGLYAYNGGGIYAFGRTFGSSATTPYTAIVQATAGNVVQVKDFEAAKSGSGNIYWPLETAPDEWSIFGARESPLQWRTIAKKENGAWYARTSTNGLEATTATDAPSAITIALTSNSANRIISSAYSPYYGYSAFEGGIPVRWAATFWPDTNSVATNAPCISGIYTLSSQFSDTLHWATADFRIDLTSTNPASSTVTWPEDYATRAAIYCAPKREEEE